MQIEHREGGLRFAFLAVVVMLACLTLAAVPALAQEPADEAAGEQTGIGDPDDADAEEPPPEIEEAEYGEEIVVTARRREESVQDVPVAVTVTSGTVLEDAGSPDISVLQDYVPNLSLYAGRNQSTTLTAFMRGIGQADPLWGVDPGVGLYLDDVYMARPQGALLDVFDVERVEVLRGPQGTLYGKNTIGGAIKYVSRAPTDSLEARFSLAGGSYSTQNVRGSISGPLVEGKLRAKLSVASLQRDGFGENRLTGRDVSDKDSFAARLSFDWLPSENVMVRLSADTTDDDAEPKGYQRLITNDFCAFYPGVGSCAPLNDRFDTQSGLAPLNSTDSEGYSMLVTWRLNPAWEFKSITAYRESDSENNIDFDTTPAPIVDVSATYNDEQLSQELQLVYTGGERLNGVFGLYYFDGEAGGRVENIFLGGLPFAQFGTTEGTTFTESYALFADGSYRLTDRLTLNAGLRVTEEEKRGVAFNAGYADDSFTTPVLVLADFDKSETFTSVAPRLGFDYKFSDDVMGYLSLSRGFKSGGFNVRAQSTFFPASADPFDDEVLDVVEVGLKSILADRQLVLNAAAFYGDYSDIQVSTFTAADLDGDGVEESFFGNFVNAGDATMEGLELEFDWNPRDVHWFGLQGNLSWLDATPDSFLDENNDGFVDTRVITNAPEYTAGLRVKLDFPVFEGLLTGTLGANYRDDSVLTNEGGPDPRDPTRTTPLLPLVQDSYTTVSFTLDWFNSTGKWGFRVNGYNLTDEEYLTNGYNIPVLRVVTGSYGAPRTIVAGFEYRLF